MNGLVRTSKTIFVCLLVVLFLYSILGLTERYLVPFHWHNSQQLNQTNHCLNNSNCYFSSLTALTQPKIFPDSSQQAVSSTTRPDAGQTFFVTQSINNKSPPVLVGLG
jgi:hypothetical protein